MVTFSNLLDGPFAQIPNLRVEQNTVPNSFVRINAGRAFLSGAVVEIGEKQAGPFTPPVSGQRIDIVGINNLGNVVIIVGPTGFTPPHVPVPPINNFVPLALVLTEVGVVAITNKALMDIRFDVRFGLPPTPHNFLTNRSDPDQHPESAITGLVADLANRATLAQLALKADIADLAFKADTDGTPSRIFKLKKGFTGTPSDMLEIEFGRGAQPSAFFRWDEVNDRFVVVLPTGDILPVAVAGASGIDILQVDGMDVVDDVNGRVFLVSSDDDAVDLVPTILSSTITVKGKRCILFQGQALVPLSSFVDMGAGYYKVPAGRVIKRVQLSARNPALAVNDFLTLPDPDRRVKIFVAHLAGGPVVDFFTVNEDDPIFSLGVDQAIAGDRIGIVFQNLNGAIAKNIAGYVKLFDEPV